MEFLRFSRVLTRKGTTSRSGLSVTVTGERTALPGGGPELTVLSPSVSSGSSWLLTPNMKRPVSSFS